MGDVAAALWAAQRCAASVLLSRSTGAASEPVVSRRNISIAESEHYSSACLLHGFVATPWPCVIRRRLVTGAALLRNHIRKNLHLAGKVSMPELGVTHPFARRMVPMRFFTNLRARLSCMVSGCSKASGRQQCGRCARQWLRSHRRRNTTAEARYRWSMLCDVANRSATQPKVAQQKCTRQPVRHPSHAPQTEYSHTQYMPPHVCDSP